MVKNTRMVKYQCPVCQEDMTKAVLEAQKESTPWYSIARVRVPSADRASVVVLSCPKGHLAKYSLD